MQTRDYVQTDKILGIVIMVFNALCGVCGGIFVTFMGGAIGALGGAAATSGAPAGEAAGGAAAAAAVGGMTMILGIIMIALSAVGVAGGYGVMKGLRWGFLIVAISSGLNVLFSLFSLPASILGLIISGALLYYSYMRLQGKWGDKPV